MTTVEIWSDIACPWCYVGKRRFEAALAQWPHGDAVEVVWRSFELDPSAPAERTGDYAARLAAKYGTTTERAADMVRTMTETAAVDGLDFRFDHIRSGNTFDAHRLLHLAAEHGLQDALKERFLRAYLTEGEPIGDPDALARLAVEVGLAEADVRSVLSSDAHAAAVVADEAEAAALGISGVPFFVIDRRYGVSGAQSVEVFVDVLERARTDAALTVVGATAAPGSGCEGDSCAV